MQAVKVTFTLPQNIINELSQFAKELGEKKSHIVTHALNQYFDILDLQLAYKRANEIKNNEVKTISFDDIKKEINL